MEQIKFIKEDVMSWLEAGIVKWANWPFNSPIFCVLKKQGQILQQILESSPLGHRQTLHGLHNPRNRTTTMDGDGARALWSSSSILAI
jgi:hypothetical protein